MSQTGFVGTVPTHQQLKVFRMQTWTRVADRYVNVDRNVFICPNWHIKSTFSGTVAGPIGWGMARHINMHINLFSRLPDINIGKNMRGERPT